MAGDLPEHFQAILASAVKAAAEEAVKAALAQVRQGPPPDPRTMGELWSDYLPTLTNEQSRRNAESARKKGYATFRHLGQSVRLLDLTYSQLTKQLLRDWITYVRNIGLKPGTVDHARKAWQSMLAYYVKREEFPSNPFSGIEFELKPGEGQRLGYFTEAELEDFLPHCTDIVAAMARTMARAGGLRLTECLTLRKDQIDYVTKKGWCRRKGGKITTFLVPDDVLELLRKWSEVSRGPYIFANPNDVKGRPYSPQTFHDMFNRAARSWGKRLHGGEKPVPHHLRHTYAVHMLEKGAPEVHVSQQLGHASAAELARYGKLRGASEETYREKANMSVAQAKRPKRAEYACPACSKTYPTIQGAAACDSRHARSAK